jgi:D-alanyl-D-alanine carboxypeptidase/D-alanyl-D-alanine-endopeptidase (penicillin-binding protein 4)
MRVATVLAALLLGAVTCGCAKAVSSPAAPTPTAQHRAAVPPSWSAGELRSLQRRLHAVLDVSALATSGIAILDEDARPLFVRRDRTPFAPASTFKLLAAVSALVTFGADYRFETTFEALEPPRDGALLGDVYLVGSGDPSLTSDDLRAAAGVLARAGVGRIEGGIVADASAFGGPEINAAWDPGDLQYGFAAGTSALSLDEGTVEFHLVPSAVGAPARIVVRPPSDDVRVNGGVTTAYTTSLAIERSASGNAFTFSGSLASGAEQSFWRPVADLPHYAAAAARRMLQQRGIDVDGGARTGVAPLGATVLWRHPSAPLAELIGKMLFESDNHYAEQLLRALGAEGSSVGTERTGAEVERAVLRRFGVPDEGLRVIDGSGLAASDRIAPLSLAMLLARAAAAPQGPVLVRSLPRVGIEGTVRRHDVTIALGRARAKSGHIENVNALAGFVETHRHGRVAFAFLVNDVRADDGPVVAGMDRALDVLASE